MTTGFRPLPPRPPGAGRLRGRDGFTLVEALTAFVVLALLTLVVQRSLVMARTGLSFAESRTEAERVARTLLDEPVSRTVSRGGGRSGVTEGRRWTVSAQPLDLPPARPGAAPPRPEPAGTDPARAGDPAAKGPDPAAIWRPLRVTIRVETTAGRVLEVETVRLARTGDE